MKYRCYIEEEFFDRTPKEMAKECRTGTTFAPCYIMPCPFSNTEDTNRRCKSIKAKDWEKLLVKEGK